MAQIHIHRDGTVETLCGTQDIGGGARTVCLVRTSMAFGWLPMERIRVKIGSSEYGNSGASAGSSTTGGVSREIQEAAKRALAQLFDVVAEKLGVPASTLEIQEGGEIAPRGRKGLSWSAATALLRDTVIGHASTPKDPDAQWCVLSDEDDSVRQMTEKDYHL